MKTIKKKITFWNSLLPLTSKRANYILSRPNESKRLVEAVRKSKANMDFDVTKINFSSQEVAREVKNIT